MRGLPSPSAVRDYDSLRKDNVNGTATNIERVEDHLEDLDHYLRLSPKNVGTSPSGPKQPTTPVAFEMDEAHAEAEAEKEAPATEEEKKEGVKQLLMMLRAQKAEKKKKEKSSGNAESSTEEKPKKKKKMKIVDGNLVIIAVDDDGEEVESKAKEEEAKKEAFLQRILALAEKGKLEEVEELTRTRLAELHGTQVVRVTTKSDFLKALKTGDKGQKLLKKGLFRISEGISPDGLEFMSDPAYWEAIGAGLTVTGSLPPTMSPVKGPIRPSTGLEWKESLSTYGYFNIPGELGARLIAPNDAKEEPLPTLFETGTEVEREIDNTWYPAVVRSSTPPSSPGESPTYDIQYRDDGNKEAGVEADELRGDAKAKTLAKLSGALQSLLKAGWSSHFIFMYDEAWEMVHRMWPIAEEMLGEGVTLDPRLCAVLSRPKESRIDMSGGPNRGHTHAETFNKSGEPLLLKLVAMLSESSPWNGGLTVVPAEYDDYYDAPEAFEHLTPATETDPNVLSIKFGIQALRPIQAQAGAVIGVAGNVVTWQNRCATDQADDPNTSLNLIFRAGAARPVPFDNDALLREDVGSMSVSDRLCHVTRSCLLDAIDGKLGMASFPPTFTAVLVPPATK